MKTITYTMMTNEEWDKLVITAFGRKGYEIAAEEEMGNGDLREVHAEKQAVQDFYKDHLSLWINGAKVQAPPLWVLAADMVSTGALEPGHYLIKLSY